MVKLEVADVQVDSRGVDGVSLTRSEQMAPPETFQGAVLMESFKNRPTDPSARVGGGHTEALKLRKFTYVLASLRQPLL
jgi:hypothetical protein